MKCPFCNYEETQVVDTRVGEDKLTIKRRRKCIKCDKRFNTFEKIDLQMPMIVKNNGIRQEYSDTKLRSSFIKALHKRAVSIMLVDSAIESIRQKILSLGEQEVSSRLVGDMVMNELAKLDKVAYIRFASIYRSFQDITDFSEIIKSI